MDNSVRFPPPPRRNPAPVAPLVPAGPAPVPPHLQADRDHWDGDVRQMQSINRFSRTRAVLDQVVGVPLRGLGVFLPIPIPDLRFIGISIPMGLQHFRINDHEGKDPTRLRTHLFEQCTSRRTSKKIVSSLAALGVLNKDHRFLRPITDAELLKLQTQYHLDDEATVRIRWALETFAQISREVAGQAPSRWSAAMPQGGGGEYF